MSSLNLHDDLARLQMLHAEQPDGDHVEALMAFADTHLGGPESAVQFLTMIQKSTTDPNPVIDHMLNDLNRVLSEK